MTLFLPSPCPAALQYCLFKKDYMLGESYECSDLLSVPSKELRDRLEQITT